MKYKYYMFMSIVTLKLSHWVKLETAIKLVGLSIKYFKLTLDEALKEEK